MFIHCRNDKCKNYYEDSCMKNLEDKMVCFDENGHCEDFEEGVNEGYFYSEGECCGDENMGNSQTN